MQSLLVCGGDEGDRTLDLTDANRTLSQLSYAPVEMECFLENGDAIHSLIVRYVTYHNPARDARGADAHQKGAKRHI